MEKINYKSKYSEKLKDPRWQKKRLTIFNRDKWLCRICKDDTSTLHVHHFSYDENPWDSPNAELVTLCETCHETFGSVRKISSKKMTAKNAMSEFFKFMDTLSTLSSANRKKILVLFKEISNEQ